MYMKDGLHLSGKGAAVFADELSAAVESGMGSIKIVFKLEVRRVTLRCLKQDKRPLVHKKPVTKGPENISEAGYKCVCLNTRSIVNTKNKLNIMVEDTDPHTIGITESWANID